MSKRKAPVNDIIYELDNDDVEISSDEEVKHAEIVSPDTNISSNLIKTDANSQNNCSEVINIDSSVEILSDLSSPIKKQNGGKTSEDVIVIDNISNADSPESPKIEIETNKKHLESAKTTIFNEDIIVDSPASNSDLGVVGCENRTPLVTVRFRDSKLAMNYKKQIKEFMLNLIKLHENDSGDLDNETDLELDIWPEDVEQDVEKKTNDLFFVDTDPGANFNDDIPNYSQTSTDTLTNHSNIIETEVPQSPYKKGPICFNCEGDHALRDCILPRNMAKINERRKNKVTRVGRYHVEDEQKYGHLIPGRISGQLRNALGLKRHELPLHIYQMRVLGYPPGWLEEARISHSGITMFDSTGRAIQDPDEEEGEVCDPGSKDKFDIKKILDFPGFNVPASSRYREECDRLGMPPMSELDSKMAMLQTLAPNAMMAYKRKKLAFFPSAPPAEIQEGHAEMELDSGDEVAEFPSQPPLPDDAPPPLPPPPENPPPPPESPPPPPESPPLPPETPPPPPEEPPDDTEDDLVVIEVTKVQDIPLPAEDIITIDEEGDPSLSVLESATLDDLEQKKKLLLDALQSGDVDDNTEIDKPEEPNTQSDATKTIESTQSTQLSDVTNSQKILDNTDDTQTQEPIEMQESSSSQSESQLSSTQSDISNTDPNLTPNSKAGKVKSTDYGTPVLNIASPYLKLPTDDKFAKNICDVIYFDNLPNQTGKYKQISTLLKKVKNEVDRIQES